MSTNSLEDRGRALEDEFFHKQDQERLSAIKAKLEASSQREALRQASGMKDDAVLDRLIALGVSPSTLAALAMVPLVTVAWADGKIQEIEREQILASAHDKGLDRGTPGYDLLTGWLSTPPSEGLMVAWESYIRALRAELNEDQARKIRLEVVGFAKLVAGGAGGMLGFGKVSGGEVAVIQRIEAAFAP